VIHWTWLLTVTVRAGESTPLAAWLWWHYHVLLPPVSKVPA